MALSRKQKIWIFIGLVVILFFSLGFIDHALSAPVIRVMGDSMDWRSRWLMGLHGIDCGRVRVNGDPKAATDCALKAQRDGKPFRVRYDLMGFDSAVAGGIVRTPSGALYALSFDSNPSGSGEISLLEQSSNKDACPQPYRLWVNAKGRVNCFQQALSYPQNITSPNMEPY